MLTVIDILIYVFFAFLASSIAKKSDAYINQYDKSSLVWDKYLLCYVLFFTVIGAIRWNVGVDSLSYAYWFSVDNIKSSDREGLWWYFVSLIRATGFHWSFGLGVCALFQIFFIVLALRRWRWLLVFIPFAFFGGRYWMDCMNAVRQMIVACGFLWATRFIIERSLWRYIAFVAIASLVHQSALLLLVFYWVPAKLDLTKYKFQLIVILLICVFLGQTPAFQGAVKYLQLIAGATNYENYSELMSDMLLAGATEEALSFGPMMLSYLLIAIFIIWFGSRIQEEFGKDMPCLNLWFNLSYFYACGYFLVCNISHLFIRPMMYFSLFQMVMAALVLYYLYIQYKFYGLMQKSFIAFCIIIATNTTWDVMKASGQDFETTTYKVFFNHTSNSNPLGIKK